MSSKGRAVYRPGPAFDEDEEEQHTDQSLSSLPKDSLRVDSQSIERKEAPGFLTPVHAHSRPAPGPAFDAEDQETKTPPSPVAPNSGASSGSSPSVGESSRRLSHSEALRYRLKQVEVVLGKVVHKVYDVFGAAVVWTSRPDGTTSCACTVLNEVRLAFWILIICLLIVVGVVAIIQLITGQVDFDTITQHKHYIAISIAFPFCVAATYVTHIQVKAHQQNWTAPKTQIKIVRIIRMVPIYAWSAFIGLILVDLAPYVDFIRVCYEAYVIYNFLLLLTKYLGGHMGVVAVLKEKPEQNVKWPAPFCCFPRAHVGSTFLWAIKRGTMQYVLISPIVAFAAVVMAMTGTYGDGVVDWNEGYVYVAIIQNFTQLIALYCLVWFYMVTKDDLAVFKPLAKFLVVKSVVFFTFWQGVGINLLCSVGVIQDTQDFSANEIQLGLQDFIICIEMFIAAAVHRWTFGHEMFADGSYVKMMDECRARAKKAGVEVNSQKDDVFYDLEVEHPGLEDAHSKLEEFLPIASNPNATEEFAGAVPKRRMSSLSLNNASASHLPAVAEDSQQEQPSSRDHSLRTYARRDVVSAAISRNVGDYEEFDVDQAPSITHPSPPAASGIIRPAPRSVPLRAGVVKRGGGGGGGGPRKPKTRGQDVELSSSPPVLDRSDSWDESTTSVTASAAGAVSSAAIAVSPSSQPSAVVMSQNPAHDDWPTH